MADVTRRNAIGHPRDGQRCDKVTRTADRCLRQQNLSTPSENRGFVDAQDEAAPLQRLAPKVGRYPRFLFVAYGLVVGSTRQPNGLRVESVSSLGASTINREFRLIADSGPSTSMVTFGFNSV